MYKRKDHFYQKAKREGKASRAAYKIEEIQKKYRLIQPGDAVLELGAAPGGWLQMIQQMVGPLGFVVGIDRLPLKMQPASNAFFIQTDFSDAALTPRLRELLHNRTGFKVIVSDLSPDLTGIHFRDRYQSFEMAQKVFSFCPSLLMKGGHLVMKIFPSDEFNRWKKELAADFQTLQIFIPEATRKASSEVYLVAKGYKSS